MADPTPVETGLSGPDQAVLAPEIAAALSALRRRIRWYVWLEGLGFAALALGLAFWASLAIDWLFEPARPIRVAILAAVGALLAILLFEMIGRRAFIPLSDSSMALLLERRYKAFRESLLTAVELSPRTVGDNTQRMIAQARRRALAEIRGVRLRELFSFSIFRFRLKATFKVPRVRLREVFNTWPLRRALAGGVLGLGSVMVFVGLLPDAAAMWARRSVLLDDALWPRRTRVTVDGFVRGVTKVARGTDLEVVARADTRMPWVPETAEIRYWATHGPRNRAPMTRVGLARRGADPYQEYSYTFRGLLAPLNIEVHAGDDTAGGLRIEVVDSPAVVEMELQCVYPGYIGRPAGRVPVTGAMQLPVGTQATLRAKANKELASVKVEAGEEQPVPPETVGVSAADRRSFEYRIGRLDKDRTLLFTLSDTDGIRSRDPVRLSLGAVADEPPRLALQLRGIGPAIVPRARLPVAGQVDDDYGVARAWFECTVGKNIPIERPIELDPADPSAFKLQTQLDVEPLALKPGAKLLLSVKAADRCDLRTQPNIGASERWLLDVVTPEQLRGMLEARELVLRQRFEAIMAEVGETRDLLEQIDFGSRTGTRLAKPEVSKATKTVPDDEAVGQEGSPQERILVRVERAVQNGRKNGLETHGVSEAFEDIALELVNNRIDTEELIGRVRAGIAEPLGRIAEQMFPELDRRLERLRAGMASKSAEELRAASRQQVAAILAAMQEVLGRMLELESFNEAVELLRSIIAEQQKLNEQTRQRHKERLRDLLKE